MKFWKHSLIAACTFLCISTVVTYSSCTTDSCKALKCRNGGTCADEFCFCPDGWEGTQCEIFTRNRYVGAYDGITKIDNEPVIIDSLYMDNEPDTRTGVVFYLHSRAYKEFKGEVTKEGAFISDMDGKKVHVTLFGGDDKLEILIEETVNGKKSQTHFQGTKR